MRVVYNFQNDEAMRRALAEIKADEKSVARTRMILRILIIICVGVLYYNGYKLIANGIIDGYSIFAIVFGTAALIYAIMLKRVQVWMILRNVKRMDKDYLNGYGTWTFSDEGIATDSTLGKGETPWSSVEKYGDHSHFIYIQRKDKAVFLIDRTLLSEAELAELSGLLKKYATWEE